jgi:hypothetical protein
LRQGSPSETPGTYQASNHTQVNFDGFSVDDEKRFENPPFATINATRDARAVPGHRDRESGSSKSAATTTLKRLESIQMLNHIPSRISSYPMCSDAWHLFVRVQKISRILDISACEARTPEPGCSRVQHKARVSRHRGNEITTAPELATVNLRIAISTAISSELGVCNS